MLSICSRSNRVNENDQQIGKLLKVLYFLLLFFLIYFSLDILTKDEIRFDGREGETIFGSLKQIAILKNYDPAYKSVESVTCDNDCCGLSWTNR